MIRCDRCGERIYDGDEIWVDKITDEVYCCMKCVTDSMFQEGEAEEIEYQDANDSEWYEGISYDGDIYDDNYDLAVSVAEVKEYDSHYNY